MAGRRVRLAEVGEQAVESIERRDSLNRVDGVLERCGLAGKRSRPARTLALLDLKRLELARALATQPSVLLLDEVAAGLVGRELAATVDLVAEIHATGVTMIVVEHVEQVVRSLVARVIVLDWGRQIAEGSPDEIRVDPLVRSVYLGTGTEETPLRFDQLGFDPLGGRRARWAEPDGLVLGGKLIEIGQAGQAEFVAAMHSAVARKSWLEAEGLAGIGAHAFRSPADHIPLLGEERNQPGMRPGHVRAIFFHVEKRRGIFSL